MAGKLFAGTWAGAIGFRPRLFSMWVLPQNCLDSIKQDRLIPGMNVPRDRKWPLSGSWSSRKAGSPCRKAARHHFSIFYWPNHHRALPELRTTDMDLKSRNCYLITTIYWYKIIHLVLLPFKYPNYSCISIFILLFVSLSTPFFLSFQLIIIYTLHGIKFKLS